MKLDMLGRLRNMDLPDGKTAVLYSVYEAVSNSIHAINDRFGEEQAAESGEIEVDIELNDNGEVNSIEVTDNGIGFTPDNLDSFDTSDSRYKYQRGGKGVGRFVWFKTFSKIRVESTYKKGRSHETVTFKYDPLATKSVKSKRVQAGSASDLGSWIEISGPRKSQGGRMNQASFMKDLALHFLPLHIGGLLPEITLTYDGETRSLADYIEGKIDDPVRTTKTFEVDGENWTINIDHIYVDPTISTELKNSYMLTAHGRLVGDPISITRKFALNELANGKAYVAVISGDPLDERVDQQRLGFRFNANQKEALETAVLEGIEEYLHEHVEFIRKRQRAKVESVLFEHPQLASQIENLDEYVKGLSPGMDDEQIGQNLFTLLYREERDIRKRVATLAQKEELSEHNREEIERVLEELSDQERNRLAELVVKRHQVLQAAQMLLKYSDEEKESYAYEKAIHELICPMGRMFTSGDYDDHNLWIIDESLAGYQFFASDKPIKSFVMEGGSLKEPDLIFFNPLGFRREGTDEPISIVEFKRPGDGTPTSNPVDQVLGYIEELRSNSVKDMDGEIVCDIKKTTPFTCFIVCELTDATRRMIERSVAQTQTPDGEGYYGWSTPHNAFIQVVSFKKMLRDAYIRSRVYFDALKLENPSAGARRRAARARDKRLSLSTGGAATQQS